MVDPILDQSLNPILWRDWVPPKQWLTALDQRLSRYLAAAGLDCIENQGRPVFVLGLSGGADSVALLALMRFWCRLRSQRLIAVHVHHGLQSVAEAWPDFCADLCQKLGVDFETIAVQLSSQPGRSIEAQARVLRYRALSEVLMARCRDDMDWAEQASEAETVPSFANCGPTLPGCILTGHHLDDQVETVLIQLLRGAGAKGLSGLQLFGPIDLLAHDGNQDESVELREQEPYPDQY